MDSFCYWQEDAPINNSENYFQYFGKICLLRLNEYKIEKEAGLKETTSIFCPYKNKDEAMGCLDYKVSIYGKISK